MKGGSFPLLAKRPPDAGMVEFAMGATIFVMLMFATIELGMVVYSYNTISHAARNACATRRPTGDNHRDDHSDSARHRWLCRFARAEPAHEERGRGELAERSESALAAGRTVHHILEL